MKLYCEPVSEDREMLEEIVALLCAVAAGLFCGAITFANLDRDK